MLFATIVCALITIHQTSSSAIPVWELLSKEEKMSYLYSMFANQVEEFCEFSQNKNCNQELLKYGLRKLKNMPEDHLDSMDPYQRGANHIIWDSMMEGHEMKQTTAKARPTTTPKPNSYDDTFSFGSDELGNQGAASAKIDNVYRVAPPRGFIYVTPANNLPYNIHSGIPEYKQFPEYLLPKTQEPERYAPVQETVLTGPMVVRVYPDGTPVRESLPSIPQDEDLRQYKLSQIRLPSV